MALKRRTWASARLVAAPKRPGRDSLKAARGQAGGRDPVSEPGVVHFREEAADLAPASSLATFSGIPYQHDEEVQPVPGGLYDTVRRRPYKVAGGGEELQENGRGVGFGVRRDGPDHGPGDAVKGRRSKARPKGIPLRRRRRGIRLMESGSGVIFLLLRLRLVKQAQQTQQFGVLCPQGLAAYTHYWFGMS